VRFVVISSALGWLKHYSLLGFFGLAFGISWSIWLPLVVMQAFLPFSVIAILVWIGGFAPTIAAIIFTGVNSGWVFEDSLVVFYRGLLVSTGMLLHCLEPLQLG